MFFAARPKADRLSSPPIAGKAQRKLPPMSSAFWKSAIVPESDEFRSPTGVANPARPKPVDYAAEVPSFVTSGNAAKLNIVLPAWFDVDPVAARDWLAAQKSFALLQPALSRIAGQIAEAGDPEHALEWAKLLEAGPAQEHTLFDIYALAARFSQFSEDLLRAAPLPPERVNDLLSGAAGD